jgi:hypothetical protein
MGDAVNGQQAVKALALFAAVQATFSDVHPFCDQIVQNGDDAINKGRPGWVGRKACARHVATYSAGQFIAAAGVTRALGFRASWSGLSCWPISPWVFSMSIFAPGGRRWAPRPNAGEPPGAGPRPTAWSAMRTTLW